MAPKSTKFDLDFYETQGKKDIIFHGDAHFPKETAVLRLTKTDDHDIPLQNSSGRVVYSKPVAFSHAAEFDTTIKFNITPGTNSSYHADGLVFFIVPHGHAYPKEPHGGNLGIFEKWGKTSHVFAAGFDIYPRNPGYITLGIYIQSREEPVESVQVPASFIGKDLTLSISYDSSTHVISVSATDDNETYPVSCEHDLSHLLPPSVVVGLASSTGDYVALHDVNSWSFTSTA
ncbi:lectin-like [Salvia hispanica]|uniref:lectin-like n=1 Tax=Salvia hispanica TaxID=49212 RepID=UPI002009D643|nr:lectin-like [Salvia hispanica]XP_047952481.1 lectin-like [Salvia hispanica]